MTGSRQPSETDFVIDLVLQKLRVLATGKEADMHPKGNGVLHYLLGELASQHLGKKQRAQIEEIIQLHKVCCYHTPMKGAE